MNKITQLLRKGRSLSSRFYNRNTAHQDSALQYQNGVDKQMKRAQTAWIKHMGKYKNSLGVVILPENAPVLSDKHIANCRLLPNREAVIRQMKKGGIVAEVGVQKGEFSQLILQTCQPTKFHLIDLSLKYYGIDKRFKSEIDAGVVHLHEGDSSAIVRGFPDRYFDFIYIDADHSYEGVKRDIQAAKAKIKDGGFLLFNDYTYWSPAECMPYGVIQGVNELCIEEDWEMTYFALGGYMYCDVAIRRCKDANE
jgi:hypothetical protein